MVSPKRGGVETWQAFLTPPAPLDLFATANSFAPCPYDNVTLCQRSSTRDTFYVTFHCCVVTVRLIHYTSDPPCGAPATCSSTLKLSMVVVYLSRCGGSIGSTGVSTSRQRECRVRWLPSVGEPHQRRGCRSSVAGATGVRPGCPRSESMLACATHVPVPSALADGTEEVASMGYSMGTRPRPPRCRCSHRSMRCRPTCSSDCNLASWLWSTS